MVILLLIKVLGGGDWKMGRIEGRVGKQTQGNQEECEKRGKWVFQVFQDHTDGYMMEKKKTGECRIKQQEEETN